MTLTPILDAEPVVQIHILAALVALILGPVALYGRKSLRHKIAGYTWITAMLVLCGSSFFIRGFAVIGPFGPIHLFSFLALWSIFDAMRQVFRGRIDLHRTIMRNLYWYGIWAAMLLNFLPGRTISKSLFPDTPEAGWGVIALGVALIGVRQVTLRRRSRAPVKRPALTPKRNEAILS